MGDVVVVDILVQPVERIQLDEHLKLAVVDCHQQFVLQLILLLDLSHRRLLLRSYRVGLFYLGGVAHLRHCRADVLEWRRWRQLGHWLRDDTQNELVRNTVERVVVSVHF